MVIDTIWLWVLFNVGVLVLLALDLGVFHRHADVISVKEALVWSAIWIGVAAAFNIGVFVFGGATKGFEFMAGYIIERALSIDNIFVFILVFSYFSVPAKYQYRVLFWGILGALVMRAVLIALGTTLIEQFHFVIYLFGALLIYSGFKMAFQKDADIHPENNPVVKQFVRVFPVTKDFVEGKFFTRIDGRLLATPLFVVLLVVETTDLVFALDSIPAIFGVTLDPFIVYTSNVFAILGLRAMYFAIAGLMDKFHYLKFGLSLVLAFVGVKMLLSDVFHLSIELSLIIVTAIIAISVILSLVRPREEADIDMPYRKAGPGDLTSE
jgi:tellurite resistance protein TerC